jgi:predicted RNase H-like nuclease
MRESLYLGIDSCSYGWISFIINQTGWNIEIFRNINPIWKKYNEAKLILIDIPIGLRSETSKARLCDSAARKFLTRKRSSSIFPTPCRQALNASSYQEANSINRSITGKGVSKQTYNIMPKIKEVDKLLRRDDHASNIIIESHPEVCFTALNNGKPLEDYKKTKNGMKQRLSLLNSVSDHGKKPLYFAKNNFKRNEVAIDDILDAWVLAISASKGKSALKFLPTSYEFDKKGLPMRIAFCNSKAH